MSSIETAYAVLQSVLDNAKKDFICPLCLKSYSRADSALLHCRNEGNERNETADNEEKKRRCRIHRGLGAVNTGGDFRDFRNCLAAACGRKEIIPVTELPLDFSRSHRRPYGCCLKRNFILQMMTSELAARAHILREKSKIDGIHYACPCCLSWFATSDGVLEHCAKMRDENHQGLLSADVEAFARFYGNSLGRMIDLSVLTIDFDGHGKPLFDRCFEIDEVLKYKSKCAIKLFNMPLRY